MKEDKERKFKDLRSRFGFHTTPFTREIRIQDIYALPFFEEALTGLLRAIEERMSAVVIAPSGTGKSVLLRTLSARLPEARFKVHYVKVTDLSKRDMCREIATAVGAAPAATYPGLVRTVQERFLAMTDGDGLRPVLLLDEAHDMRPDVLGMVRLITNFDMDSRLVVSVILAGQPPLEARLFSDSMVDIARRLAHTATLRILSKDETKSYIQHRCAVAGAATVPLDAGAMETIFGLGHGNLRATDQLALKSFDVANDDGCDVVDSKHVIQARRLLWPPQQRK